MLPKKEKAVQKARKGPCLELHGGELVYEAAVAAEVVANGAPEDAALGLELSRAVHCLRRELVEGHQVLHHAHRLVERAVAARVKNR